MASSETSIPASVIDAAMRYIFGDLKLPEPGGSISDRALMLLIRSQKRSGYTSRFEAEGRGWSVAKTDFGPSLWIAADWIQDAPTLQGDDSLAALRRAFSLSRPDDDPGLEPVPAAAAPRTEATPAPPSTTLGPAVAPPSAPALGGGGGGQQSLFW